MKTKVEKFLLAMIGILICIGAGQYSPLSQTSSLVITQSEKKSGNFTIRGIKGWAWTPEQYLEEIPRLAAIKMNFLMNCYFSMFDIEHYPWTDGRANQWWKPLPKAKKRAYEKIVRTCQEYGIEFCFSMNPNVNSPRFANPDSAKDLEDLWRHYSWMQSLGVRWFNISLDDIGARGDDPVMQARLVNELFRRLRKNDNYAQMIFCPSWYWGDGSDAGRSYLQVLAKELNSEVYVFWTGDKSITPRITRKAAESYKATVGHRLIIWDNYPCNDGAPTMHLGPLTGRDPDLCEVADGYMSNSMHKQNRINRLPLMTCADYAFDPRAYNPDQSIERAIASIARNADQVRVLKYMIENYPSNLDRGQNQLYNPVRQRLDDSLRAGESMVDNEWYPGWIEDLAFQLTSIFKGYYRSEYDTLMDDAEWIRKELYKNRKTVQPPL